VLFTNTTLLHIPAAGQLNDRRVRDEEFIILSLDDQNILLSHL